MSQTLLEIVQDILSEMISDDVTSINDTDESLTVAKFVRTVYKEMAATMDLPEDSLLFNLTETSVDTPTVMLKPTDMRTVDWVRYEKSTEINSDLMYVPLTYVPVKQFLDIIYGLTESDDNTLAFDYTTGTQTFSLLYRNDKHPEVYTTFDDETLLFDSFYSPMDTFLRSSKTVCSGRQIQTFDLDDTFVPPLQEGHFPLLIAEVRKRAFDFLKDRIPDTANRAARQQRVSFQRTQPTIAYGSALCTLPHYGKK